MFDLFKIAWKSPREAVHFVNDHSFSKYWFVMFLAGFGNLSYASIDPETGNLTTIGILMAIIFAIPSVWIGAVVAGFVTHIAAKLFGGTGTFKAMRKGYYVSLLPYVLATPLAIIYFILINVTNSEINVYSMIMALLLFVIGIVTIVLEVIVISEVENISIGRAIGTMIVTIIFGFIIVMIIIVAIIAILAIGGSLLQS